MATIRELERGVWLAESVPEDFRREVERLCYFLADCVADLVVSLSLFEQARAEASARNPPPPKRPRNSEEMNVEVERRIEEWERESERERRREAELEAEAGIVFGQPGYFEKSTAIREQARREMLREKWAKEGLPEAYRRRVVWIHAQSFVSTLALLQRSLLSLTKYPFEHSVVSKIKKAADDFAAAFPGLKDVRDSVAHIDERVLGKARGKKIDTTKPVVNSAIHAPSGGAMFVSMLRNQHYGGTIADGTYAEVEVSDATTEVARAAVQAVYDALPWRPGPRHVEPSI